MNNGRDLIYVVHGSNAHTWWRRMANGGYPWWRRWSLFCCALRRAFGSDCEIREFRWSGANTHQARLEGAAILARAIEKVASSRAVHIVGHSHGGNVALAAASRLTGRPVQTIVLLANPHMAISQKPGGDPEWLYWGDIRRTAKCIWNLYSPQDRVQGSLAHLFHGLTTTQRKGLLVHRTFSGSGHDEIKNGIILWDSPRAAHSALHSEAMGTVVGNLLRGKTFADAMHAAHLSLDTPNPCKDRGGWAGIERVEELIRERANPQPFDIGEGRDGVGILLVHGFTASPSEMRPLAEALVQRHQWRCKAILLPGHGSRIEDMKNTTGDDWIKAVEAGYFQLARECRDVFVAGLSLGGSLACQLALRQGTDPKLRGLILLAPAFGVTAKKRIGLRILRPWTNLKSKGTRAADYFLDHRLYSYLQTPLDLAAELLRIGDHSVADLDEIRHLPVMLLAGDLESTVSLSRLHEVGQRHPWIRFVRLPNSRHILTVEPDREMVFDTVGKFVEECLRTRKTG